MLSGEISTSAKIVRGKEEHSTYRHHTHLYSTATLRGNIRTTRTAGTRRHLEDRCSEARCIHMLIDLQYMMADEENTVYIMVIIYR